MRSTHAWALAVLALAAALPAAAVDHREKKRVSGGTGREGGRIPAWCIPSSAEKEKIDAVFRKLNAYRRAHGKRALAYRSRLQGAVEAHCHHMSAHSFFSHTAPESRVRTFTKRAALCGTTAHGENLAVGYSTSSAVMSAWKGSPGHRSNMLYGPFRRVGVGYYARGSYWGQLFGY